MRFSTRIGRISSNRLERDFLRIDNASLCDEDFSGRKLKLGFRSWESTFTRCNFENMRIGDAGLGGGIQQSTYTDCSFDGTAMGMRAPGNARFVRCSFRDVKIKPIYSYACEFVDCTFTGTMSEGLVSGSPDEELRERHGRERNEITGNDLTGLELFDVRFVGGFDMTKNDMPSGEDYFISTCGTQLLARVSERVLSMPESTLREDLRLILDIKRRMTLVMGQEHLLYRRGSVIKSLRKADDTLFELLKEESETLTAND